jgi:hypothetical protein
VKSILASLPAPLFFVLPVTASLALLGACSATTHTSFTGGAGGTAPGTTGSGASSTSSGGHGGDVIIFNDGGVPDGFSCGTTCSSDFHAVVDCNGVLVQQCSGMAGCDLSTGTCVNACQAAIANKQSVGCEYYATNMDQFDNDVCFAAFVANTWNTPAQITVDFGAGPLPLANFARIPSGTGPALSYAPVPAGGLPPGEVAILFLAGSPGSAVPCPAGVTTAMPSGSGIFGSSGVGRSFHITSDVPVVSYEINPYGGGSAAVTGASLLLPTSVWDTNYVAVTVSPYDIYPPSMNIVAAEDNTSITMLPVQAVQGGGALASGPANTPYVFKLNKGQQAQFTQAADLTGSVIQSDKPIGFMAGQPCMRAPVGVAYCDHGEQMVPPVKALGNEYVGVMYRPRVPGDQAIWHLVGAVDGTQLTYSSAVGGPAVLNAGQAVDFITEQPFTVKSQDGDHPFMLFTYMSGSQWKPGMDGYGDADFVISVPPQQYMSEYVFFTDPTYPETNLVVVRSKANDKFEDVELDCAGMLTGWQPVGTDYEWTRIDLISHNFQNVGNCSTGRHDIKSKGRFGLWVWGWGTPETSSFTANVSYGYPGGMNVQSINTVVIPPQPK